MKPGCCRSLSPGLWEGVDKQGEGRIEEGWDVCLAVKRGGSHCFIHPHKVSVSLFVTLWVCVHAHSGARKTASLLPQKPRVETRNSDCFTRMRPRIYGCGSMCKGASVFSRETLCVTQDKLVFVTAVYKTHSASWNHSLGKMEKERIMSPEFWLCVGPAANKCPLSFSEPRPVISHNKFYYCPKKALGIEILIRFFTLVLFSSSDIGK